MDSCSCAGVVPVVMSNVCGVGLMGVKSAGAAGAGLGVSGSVGEQSGDDITITAAGVPGAGCADMSSSRSSMSVRCCPSSSAVCATSCCACWCIHSGDGCSVGM